MSQLQTYSDSGTWQFSAATTAFKVAGPCEVSKMKLSALTGAAFVSIYDARDATGVNPTTRKWFLDAGTAATDGDTFPNPLTFKSGVYIICEDGAALNPQFAIATVPSGV